MLLRIGIGLILSAVLVVCGRIWRSIPAVLEAARYIYGERQQ